ncbi:type VI secretion system lipoprotein TssJ [Erwinia sp. BNK-24-b]|uniref:type VI secretion system lipoprotein TssJ n=1 Tax=Erwinia TaxID=551 RepID=UPI001FEE7212|nr:type VI secretion system lipoprotein TssJ [Erwinia phyllosphaerae]MBV4367407.1 type VI secretion system lipoprotein TssJ [Erwinia phyllosphaerae]
MQKLKQKNSYASGIIIIVILLLAGCRSPFSTSKPPEFQVRLVAADNINPNEKGKPAPLAVSLYELKSADNFVNSDFFTISDGSSQTLKAEARKVYEGILQPGENRIISLSPASETVALGIVAAYREIDRAGWSDIWEMYKKHKKQSWWRKVIPGQSVALTVHFDELAISTDKMD